MVDKLGATLTTFFGAIVIGYSAVEGGVAALITWVIADVISIVRLRREIRQQRKDRQR